MAESLQDAMWLLMSRDTGSLSPDQICRALHHAAAGDIPASLNALKETNPTTPAQGETP